MGSVTPRRVQAVQQRIAENLDLHRRQQQLTIADLAERCRVSVPTIRRLLREGEGSVDTLLRVARILDILDLVEQSTDPMSTPMGRVRMEQHVPQRVCPRRAGAMDDG